MSYRKPARRIWLATLIMLVTMPGVAGAGWRVLPTTGFVTDQRQVVMVNTIGALWLRSTQNGTQYRVYQGMPVVEGDVIDAIAVCYRAEVGTDINEVGLVEFVVPGASVGDVRFIDTTDLTSSTDTCHVSPVPNYAPAGAVNLWFQFGFVSSDSGTIYIGAVAVHLK